MKIAKDGTFLETDKNGYFINSLSHEIKKPWSDAVNALVKECKGALGDIVHSIYVRGSVASGKAIEGMSDIDLVVVAKSDPKDLDLAWTNKAIKKVVGEFSFATKAELMFVNFQDFSDEGRSFNSGFVISTQSVCVYGENIQSKLPKYKPDMNLAWNLHGKWIERNIENAKERIKNAQDEEEVKSWCSWVSKRIVRAGFALVVEKEKKYTRDLYLCYRDFSKYYPDEEKEMKTLLKWSIEPVAEKQKILNMLDNFGKWLINESKLVFSGSS